MTFADFGCRSGVDEDAGLWDITLCPLMDTYEHSEESKIVCNCGKYLQIDKSSYTGTLEVC